MSWLNKRHTKRDRVSAHVEPPVVDSSVSQMRYQVPTDEEIEQKLRDIDEVNQRLAGSAELQDVFASLTGDEPPPRPPTGDELHDRIASDGLSYIMGPPSDLPEVCPEAARLHMEGAAGAFTGDDAACLARFDQALGLVRAIGHQRAEVRLLYNAGVAHYKLGEHQRAIEVLAEGRALVELISGDLRREARKLQRFEEERKIDEPRLEVFGTPDLEDKLQVMFLEALAKVYEATGLPTQASTCRAEVERLYREAGQ